MGIPTEIAPKQVLVEIWGEPTCPGEVGIHLKSSDGSDLTAQEIIDAVAEALLMQYDNYTIQPEPKYDA